MSDEIGVTKGCTRLVGWKGCNKKMATRILARKLSVLLSVSFLQLFGGCEGSFGSHHITCPIHAANRSTNEILFVSIKTAGTRNEFGFLASMGFGATSVGCEVELVPDLKIEWEEEDKKYTATVNTARYIPKRREIKSFSFLYLGNGKWDVFARSGTNDDSPEVKP
jgi:hypothetical protein